MISWKCSSPILRAVILAVALTSYVHAQEVLSTIVGNAVFATERDSFEQTDNLFDDIPEIDIQIDGDEDHPPGALLLCGGGPLPSNVLEKFFHCGNREHGKLVVIPSASRSADSGDYSQGLSIWENFNWQNVDVLHAFDRGQADAERFVEKLTTATAVWISGGDQGRLSELYRNTAVERELRKVMLRGGVVGGTSAGSAVASSVMIAGGSTRPRISDGLDLLPNAIIDQHFSQRSRFERLANAVAEHPTRVGIGIDESTGLLVKKRSAEVVGDGAVYVYAKRERPLSVVRAASSQKVLEGSVEVSHRVVQAAYQPIQELQPMKFLNGDMIQNHRIPPRIAK